MDNSDNIGDRWAAARKFQPAEVEAQFDEQAETYERDLTDWDYRAPSIGNEILVDYVKRTAKILDAGCGTGLSGAAHYEAGYQDIHGCDLSNGMLEVAKSKNIYRDLVRADLAQQLPYDDEAFDAVVCLGTLSFVENTEMAFREFCRITREKGIILFSQREDFFIERDCPALCQKLEREGLWQREFHSQWQAYIPGHPAYGDKLRVGYFVYRATKPGGRPTN